MTAIATATCGDFQYIDEWIKYHYDHGVEFFLIAYNGDSKNMHKLPKYDYVRYLDFSYDKETTLYNGLNCATLQGNMKRLAFGADAKSLQVRIFNMLLLYVREFMECVDYLCFIDIDEFIHLNPIQAKTDNINEYLKTKMNKKYSCASIEWCMYNDNGHIYNDPAKGVLKRFTTPVNQRNSRPKGLKSDFKKLIINMKHRYTQILSIQTPHVCDFYTEETDLDYNEIHLNHYVCKSLEEYISKCNPEYDNNYFRRFRGMLFSIYFNSIDCQNEMTTEKLKAIPELLKKYNIEYYPENEERDLNFREAYALANNLYQK